MSSEELVSICNCGSPQPRGIVGTYHTDEGQVEGKICSQCQGVVRSNLLGRVTRPVPRLMAQAQLQDRGQK